jgi:hypothetical protein
LAACIFTYTALLFLITGLFFVFGFPLVRKWAITTLLLIPVIRVVARRLANLLLSYCVVSGSVVYAPRTLVRPGGTRRVRRL